MSESVTPVDAIETPIEDTGSLADHEAAFHGPIESRIPIAEPVPDGQDEDETGEVEAARAELVAEPSTTGTRDAQGRFVKPERHRAKSQAASADDVEAIGALTKRIKAAEDAEGAGIIRKEGESERVFNLRRRAEILERRKAVAASAPVPRPTERPAPIETRPAAQGPDFPEFAAWAAQSGNGDKTYEQYLDARTDHRFEAREQARVKEKMHADAKAEGDRIAQNFQTKIAAAKGKYPDFQAVALDAPTKIPAGSAIDLFILEDEGGADVLYHLQRHPDELDTLLSKAPLQQVKMLSLLSQRLTTTPEAADTTGAAPARHSKPAPRPPTPVKTGPLRSADEPPDPETSSLAEHERFFHKKR